MMYQRVNQQTKEIRVGTWNQVCDLDNRLWSRSERQSQFTDSPPQPLAVIKLSRVKADGHHEYPWSKRIFSQADLVGLHI